MVGKPVGRAAVAALSLLMIASAAPAWAGGHMTSYHLSPEHDDQGRFFEPDFKSTGVLGGSLVNCVVDLTPLDAGCIPDTALAPPSAGQSASIAPGCTDDSGRRPSGLCWLSLRTGGAAGVPGMSGNNAPGRLTPTKATQIRVLDNAVYIFPLRGFINLNAKLADTGAGAALASLDANMGGSVVNPGPSTWGAWYGTWQDKNGNGVVDYMPSTTASGLPTNEWKWVGACGATIVDECIREATTMPVWFYPGNHHAFLTPDVPGLQVACFLTAAAQQGICAAAIEDIDDADEAFQGDPLLGPQNSMKADSIMDDRTDDPTNARHYVTGNGFPLQHYDQSLIVRDIVVTVVNPNTETARGFDPASGTFRDVDQHNSWSPVLESLVQNTVKPAARSSYVTVRDAYVPFNKFVDGQANNKAFDLSEATGPLDDQVLDPGRGREPNEAGDRYPGASRIACAGDTTRTHWGMCNSYAGHAGAGRAFGDLQLTRSGYLIKPSVGGIGAPLVYGPQPIDGGFLGQVNAAGDHSRALGPGFYDALGNVGVWQDKVHGLSETVFNPLTLASDTTTYSVARDGWVGNVVNTTGQYRYRGYLPEPCVLGGVAGLYEHAVCDPYSSGAGDDPQDYGSSDDEFNGGCNNGRVTVTVRPAGGLWASPTFVWRDLETFEATAIQLEDFTGRSDTISLRVDCIAGIGATTGGFVGRDQLLLPLGSLGMGVITTLTASVPLPTGGSEVFTDVDSYDAA